MSFTSLSRALFAACIALAVPMTAFAQVKLGSANANDDDYSWLPYTYKGYWGVNVGQTNYHLDCNPGFSCDDSPIGGKIYLGGQVVDWLGVEIGYVNLGSMERDGGETDAQGITAVAVATLPMGPHFNLFAKAGTTYTLTDTDIVGVPGSNIKESGFGMTVGLGAAYNMTPRSQLLLEWGRHEVQIADQNDDVSVDLYSVGYKVRF